MLRTAASKVAWVGRTASMVFGLALVLALLFSVGTMALAAVPGDPFKLGRSNSINKLSTLIGSVSGPLLKVDNNGGGPALRLEANSGKAPLVVNPAAGKAKNLNADQLDGLDSQAFLSSSTYTRFRTIEGTANGWSNGAASCDLGDQILGGGYWNADRGTTVERSLASQSSFWSVGYYNDATPDTIHVAAVCADTTP